MLKNNGKTEELMKELSDILANSSDPELIQSFLYCLFTESEVKEITSRWALVKLLDGGLSQRKISKELGLSLCKITRGSKELKKEDSAFRRMIEISKKLK